MRATPAELRLELNQSVQLRLGFREDLQAGGRTVGLADRLDVQRGSVCRGCSGEDDYPRGECGGHFGRVGVQQEPGREVREGLKM